ncbi:MAG: hypothetical protein ACI906_004910 [Candidatus Latescibacterota bacterium]|jgi:hypothetical protein
MATGNKSDLLHLNITQGLCIDIDRIEIIATIQGDLARYPDMLLDSGLGTGMPVFHLHRIPH